MARISKEKQEEIRQRIKDVAKIKFSEIGYDKVSTKMIAKEVGIAEGTLFNYFDSKTEIFFESFGDEYKNLESSTTDKMPLSQNVSEILFERFQSSIGIMLKLPRGVMGELAIASVRMAKRKPERFKRLMAYDFQFIDEIGKYIKRLIESNILDDVDSVAFSEMIFSIMGFELLLYMYDMNVSKIELIENMKKKIDILVKGYLKGGNGQ